MRCNYHNSTELRDLLGMPFPAEFIDWKPQQAGWKNLGEGKDYTKATPWVKLIAFIDNRAIMERLDDVCGVGNWRNEFQPLASGAMMAGLSLRFLDEQNAPVWVTKWDGAPATEIESVKGAISGAMKRAAVQWNIGRYLYDVDVTFGSIAADSDWTASLVTPKDKNKNPLKSFRWAPPRLPSWALPGGSGKKGVSSLNDQHRAEAAVKALTVVHDDVILPGTRAHFHGHGGKRLKDVPTLELQRASAKMTEAGIHADVVASIAQVIAARTEGGA